MSNKRYPEEFKIEAVRQITERGHKVADVAVRLGVTPHSLYAWVKKYGPEAGAYREEQSKKADVQRLKKELKRVTEERDILKKAAAYFASNPE